MALKAGRVGVRPDQVTLEGKIKGGSSSDVVKLKEQVGTFAFRVNEGQAQYKTSEEGEWENFSQGGGLNLVWSNPSPNTAFAQQYIDIDSEYNLYIVKCARTKDVGESDIRFCGVVSPNTVSSNMSIIGMTLSSTSYQRNIKITENGHMFISACSVNNNYLIPLEIYGMNI